MWSAKCVRFGTMLDAGAYESAAMSLVPENTSWATGVGGKEPEWIWAWVGSPLLNLRHAATPALALIAAALRAHAVKLENDDD